MRLLLIEDEKKLAGIMARVLRQEHFDVDIAYDGATGLDLALSGTYDALIVDRMLPGIDGLALIQQLRGAADPTPALILTALGDLHERVEGLDAGADDYLGKPFAFDELLARLRALLRRRDRPLVPECIGVRHLRLDHHHQTIGDATRSVDLSPREFALLETLARNQGQTVTRDYLLEKVWGYDADPAGNVVELYVHYVRRKLATLDAANLITTVRGVGYRIDAG